MSKRILVIDDDKFVRESFVFSLEHEGYEVDTAESGEKGIEKLAARKYDLLFLDLKMPGMNGVETLRKLREMGVETPVYIVTAFHQEFFESLKVAASQGLRFEILKKPIGNEQILLVTKSVLETPREV